jgi:hypothetical protein
LSSARCCSSESFGKDNGFEKIRDATPKRTACAFAKVGEKAQDVEESLWQKRFLRSFQSLQQERSEVSQTEDPPQEKRERQETQSQETRQQP